MSEDTTVTGEAKIEVPAKFKDIVSTIENLLSDKEREVVHWLLQGKSAVDTAQILGKSPFTVKKQIQQIYLKLNVRSRLELWAKLKLIDENHKNVNKAVKLY